MRSKNVVLNVMIKVMERWWFDGKQPLKDLLKKLTPKIDKVKEEIERIDRRGGHTFVYRKLFGEAEFNYNLAKKGNGVHNLEYTEELLEFANHRLDEALNSWPKRSNYFSVIPFTVP